ncbi:MAG: hypothetical protein KDD58_13315 [Bdellovibrionales bacterium]|nr:hypothetical protein [Bdellovibrionales bacterium]
MSKTEKFLVTFSLLVFCASMFGIFGYNKIFNKGSSQQIIARVERVSKGTRVKSPDSFEYREVKVNDPIVNGDNIISDKNSDIAVKFLNGPRLIIGEESLISLRQVDGQPDLKIEKGSFSGTFDEGDILDVLTNDEVITLNGEKDTQFSVSHTKEGETEIGSFDKELKIEYRGEKFTLKNDKASVSRTQGLKPRTPQPKSLAKDNKLSGQEKGISIDEPIQKQGMSLSPPYPKDNHIFLHKTGGKIPVYPKAQCKGACELKVSLNGKNEIKKVFARDMVPIIYLSVEPGSQAQVNWKFSDGGDETEGTFEVLENNADNFQKAFDKKLPVEVMN